MCCRLGEGYWLLDVGWSPKMPRWLTWIPAGPRMMANSTGRKNRIIGTVSFGGWGGRLGRVAFAIFAAFAASATRGRAPTGVP